MKIKIFSLYFPRFFYGHGDPQSSLAYRKRYFIMYKKHWWQRYRYFNDYFGRPLKFDSLEAAEEFLERNGIEYKGK